MREARNETREENAEPLVSVSLPIATVLNTTPTLQTNPAKDTTEMQAQDFIPLISTPTSVLMSDQVIVEQNAALMLEQII